MTTQIDAFEAAAPITALPVSDSERLAFLPRFFGPKHVLIGETLVFDWMTRLSSDYRGGYRSLLIM
jgi:hypothetical protein